MGQTGRSRACHGIARQLQAGRTRSSSALNKVIVDCSFG
jgi:hypothetical protein